MFSRISRHFPQASGILGHPWPSLDHRAGDYLHIMDLQVPGRASGHQPSGVVAQFSDHINDQNLEKMDFNGDY